MATVAIRKCDAIRMFTKLLQKMYPEVQKVVIHRCNSYSKYRMEITTKYGDHVVTGEPDDIMGFAMEGLEYVKSQEGN